MQRVGLARTGAHANPVTCVLDDPDNILFVDADIGMRRDQQTRLSDGRAPHHSSPLSRSRPGEREVLILISFIAILGRHGTAERVKDFE